MIEDRLEPVADHVYAYIDDILDGAPAQENTDPLTVAYENLVELLELMEKEGFVADIDESHIFVPEVEWCGHILGKGVRRPSPGRLMAIEKWEVPQTITELRAFLGFTNYYSAYIHEYAKIVAGLQEKLKVPHEVGKKGSRSKISWDPPDQEAFDEIKRRLLSQLVLQVVDPN